MKTISKIVLLFSIIILLSCNNTSTQEYTGFLIPFSKNNRVNPVLTPKESSTFFCPVRQETVHWEKKDVFNPAAVVKNDTLFLLYRAEDAVGKFNGTSRIGLAFSLDGYHFTRRSKPVLFPANDDFMKYEWEGGCEDPRVVEDENGTYYMTYTAYNGDKARLFIATSHDLRHWKKYGSVFQKAGPQFVDMWSKSGSIICRKEGERLIATKINEKYWMYWGESSIYMATSNNLIDWTPIIEKNPEKMQLDTMRNYTVPFQILFTTRKGKFDSELVEPGPPAIITNTGIVFIYNSKNSPEYGDKHLAPGTYAAGQVITSTKDPTQVVKRMDKWFISPDQPYEITGQVNNVCFVEGLAPYHQKWFLYYGTADSKIAVAEMDQKQ